MEFVSEDNTKKGATGESIVEAVGTNMAESGERVVEAARTKHGGGCVIHIRFCARHDW